MLKGLTPWGHLSEHREQVEQSHGSWSGILLNLAIDPTILRGLKPSRIRLTGQVEVHEPH